MTSSVCKADTINLSLSPPLGAASAPCCEQCGHGPHGAILTLYPGAHSRVPLLWLSQPASGHCAVGREPD